MRARFRDDLIFAPVSKYTLFNCSRTKSIIFFRGVFYSNFLLEIFCGFINSICRYTFRATSRVFTRFTLQLSFNLFSMLQFPHLQIVLQLQFLFGCYVSQRSSSIFCSLLFVLLKKYVCRTFFVHSVIKHFLSFCIHHFLASLFRFNFCFLRFPRHHYPALC